MKPCGPQKLYSRGINVKLYIVAFTDNIDMKFSDAIKSACGLRYLFDTLELQSGFSRRILLESHMMTSPEEITDAYAKLRIFIGFTAGGLSLSRLNDVLARLKDIRGTIDRLAGGDILDDVALFEIKELCLLSGEAAVLLKDVGAYAGGFPSLTEALDILDPDKDRLPVFHIYGSYSERLRRLRAQ